MVDIRPGVLTGTAPPQVRLDGTSYSVPLDGWGADPASLYNQRVQVAVRPVPGTRASSLWLIGPEIGGPQAAVWGAQSKALAVGSPFVTLPVSGLGAGTLAHTVSGGEVTVSRPGWYSLSALWWAQGASAFRPTLEIEVDGLPVAWYTADGDLAGDQQGTLVVPCEWLPLGAVVRVRARSYFGSADYWLYRLTITRQH